MIRKQHRFLFAAFAAALTLAWAGTAGASGPLTFQQCLANLNACTANLGTCNSGLSQAASSLATCNATLSQSQLDLAACNEEVAKAQHYLPICLANRSQLQADLAVCTSDLADCEAHRVEFPASGQTTAYTAENNDNITGAVAVPDDGAVQAGASLSYTDNGDGTITDNNTRLMWEKKGDHGGLHDKDNSYHWSANGIFETVWDWLDDINAEGGTGFAGYNDWRLPNAKELLSIVSYQNTPLTAPAAFNSDCVAGATAFTGSCTFLGNYWTSTTRSTSTTMALYVSFAHGLLTAETKVATFRVRAVRGGTP